MHVCECIWEYVCEYVFVRVFCEREAEDGTNNFVMVDSRKALYLL